METVVVGVAAALLGAGLALLLARWRWASRLAASEARVAEAQKELAHARREGAAREAERVFLSRFTSELPHLARELHSGISMRRIPAVLLNILVRCLQPQQALVLLRRRPTESEPARAFQLIVAAAYPENGGVRPGATIDIGKGELGFVAEVQLAMTRADFDQQTPVPRRPARVEDLLDFRWDIAAPMVFGEQTVGLLAVAGPREKGAEGRAALRLVAQIGALALHDVTAFSEMKDSADTDGLTRVFNKRAMTRLLAEAIVKAGQDDSVVSVYLFDIDNFKHYNDHNGHLAGDVLLQKLARVVEENTRRSNVFGRFGGEEFLLVLPGVRREHALVAAEQVRAAIAGCAFPHAAEQPLGCVSVSGGVAEFPSDALDSTRLLKAADSALYRAKEAGRNRVLTPVVEYLGLEHDPDGTLRPAPGGEE